MKPTFLCQRRRQLYLLALDRLHVEILVLMWFRSSTHIKSAHGATKRRAKRRANSLHPLRDGSEKAEGFPRQGAASQA